MQEHPVSHRIVNLERVDGILTIAHPQAGLDLAAAAAAAMVAAAVAAAAAAGAAAAASAVCFTQYVHCSSF